MYLRPANKATESAYQPAEHLIQCSGTLDEGQPCVALVSLQLSQKTNCPVCGKTYPGYSAYSRQRIRHKVVRDAG